jgi:P pilus assembly chaperone PapD
VLALCALGTAISPEAGAQLLIDPLELTINTTGPNPVSSGISLANKSDKPVQATITRSDWDRTEDGANRFLPAGSTAKSCGATLSVSPASVRLEPHSSRILRVTVQADTTLSRECWDIVFIQEVPQRSANVKGNSLEYIFRTGVKVYVAPAGLLGDAAVEGMAVVEAPTRKIAIRFHNTGATHLIARGRLEFRRVDNTVAKEISIADFPTLPGAVRRVLVDVPVDLTPGTYIALVLLDYGGTELLAGQIDYKAK